MGENVITFYTLHCPMCKSMQKAMDKKNIPYQLVDDRDAVLGKANELNINSAPFAIIDGQCYTNNKLKTWIKEY